MSFGSQFNFGPTHTPKPVKLILIITAAVSILSAIIVPHYPALHYFLNLSLDGIKHGFAWQLITYLFMVPGHKITLSFLFHLAFNLYLIWVVSCSIVDQKNIKQYLCLFFTSGVFCGLAALFIMWIGYPGYIMGGSSVILYSLLVAWLMLHHNLKLLLFFAIPVKAKWLILIILGFNLLSDLSNGDLVGFATYLTAAVFSYLYCLIVWRVEGPFLHLNTFERKVINFMNRPKLRRSKNSKNKIYDFGTGEPVNENRENKSADDKFVDEMLSKIAEKGKNSLTSAEKEKLDKIAKKKKSK
jgi:membrane associated rhomboid family serine protease